MAEKYDDWIVRGTVSEGGQAVVLLVEDSTGQRPGKFALKRLKNAGRLDLFEREVKATLALNHPNILKVESANVSGKKPYYVAEYCEGGNLGKMADRYRGNVVASVNTLLPMVSALEAAHSLGIVHRDVKPPNILFRSDGTPVLGDFGICHMEGDACVTLSDEAMGSVNYVAPEMQAGQHGPVTGAADVYALGKVLYWMLSGGRIFAREDHRASNGYLPRLFADQRWEHVHALLDGIIVTEPLKRNPMALIPSRLEQRLKVELPGSR
jgi:serine/threonine protein kinase